MPEPKRQRVVTGLRPLQRARREGCLLGIVVEVDVRTAQGPPVELTVLNLVFAEFEELRAGLAGEPEKTDQQRCGAQRAGQRRMVRMISPWVMRDRIGKPATTLPNTV
jgi:hypothetical protein